MKELVPATATDSAYMRHVEEARARERLEEALQRCGDVATEVLRAELIVTQHLLEMKNAELRLIELEIQRREVEWLPAAAAVGDFLRRATHGMVLNAIDHFLTRGAMPAVEEAT